MFGTMNCTYETPCGWCFKWDKKCDKKIGRGRNGDVGKRGMIGICPDCGRSGCISWNPDTDVSSCSCGWNNEKPQRGLRVKINPVDEALDSTVAMEVISQAPKKAPCRDCLNFALIAMPNCNKCNRENNYEYFIRLETTK